MFKTKNFKNSNVMATNAKIQFYYYTNSVSLNYDPWHQAVLGDNAARGI
jgi:hypothetical protein